MIVTPAGSGAAARRAGPAPPTVPLVEAVTPSQLRQMDLEVMLSEYLKVMDCAVREMRRINTQPIVPRPARRSPTQIPAPPLHYLTCLALTYDSTSSASRGAVSRPFELESLSPVPASSAEGDGAGEGGEAEGEAEEEDENEARRTQQMSEYEFWVWCNQTLTAQVSRLYRARYVMHPSHPSIGLTSFIYCANALDVM
jgi:hypothetical protein